jgi:hypothetical protein
VSQIAHPRFKAAHPVPDKRPPVDKRNFVSPAVESQIRAVADSIADPELAWLFTNCYPNTLDTTVHFSLDADGRPDAFIITGDIDAMWLRDSTNQLRPYLSLVSQDTHLRDLFRGLINRQAACVRLDPYANAFLRHWQSTSKWENDHTEMRRGVYERKYELDSLCSVLRLSTTYYFQTGDDSCFDQHWLQAVELIIQTLRAEQAGSEELIDLPPKYLFQRTTPSAEIRYSTRDAETPSAASA